MKLQLSNVSNIQSCIIEHSMKIVNCKLKILGVTVLFLLQLQPGIVSAQELTITPKPSPVEYTLPYPGLLPDHPLYFLRAVRDTMQTFFVSGPIEKADFYLLQADKSISASMLLSEKKGSTELAAATAFEAEQYFEKAIETAIDAKKQGIDIQEMTGKLVVANKKHKEIILHLKKGSEKETPDVYKKAEEKAQQLEKKARAVLPTK